jgi:ketosteroid isomerase-like protein
MTSKDLEQRLQRLEDVEEIKKLKARYCGYCDADYDADGIASLFTEDGVWDGDTRGRYEGREAIRRFFKGASQRVTFAIHNVMNPIIEVKGDMAHGSWYLFQACTEGGEAKWVSGRYEEDYVKSQGQWLFKALKVRFAFWTPYDQGWVKKRYG